jgi:Bestrophin, RFP-TM, chloride channel
MHRTAFQWPLRISCSTWSTGLQLFDPDLKLAAACSRRPRSVTGVRQRRVSCNLERPPRAASGWYRSLQSLPRSRVLFNVWPQVATAFVGSCIVVVLHSLLQQALGDGYVMPPLSPTPHTFLATALGLVLVFRTNAAYDRYWEGRKIWGGVVNTGYVSRRFVSRRPDRRLCFQKGCGQEACEPLMTSTDIGGH